MERRTWDNEVLWSYTLNDSTGRLHHDIEVKPDGNVFAIAWEHFSAAEALEAGRDSALVPEDGLWSEMILELAPDGNGGANMVWEWHAWDHLVQDLDSTLNLSTLPAGTYVLQFRQEAKLYTRPLNVMR